MELITFSWAMVSVCMIIITWSTPISSYIWMALMQLSGSPAMITPRSASVLASSCAMAARAAPGPESSEMPAWEACS